VQVFVINAQNLLLREVAILRVVDHKTVSVAIVFFHVNEGDKVAGDLVFSKHVEYKLNFFEVMLLQGLFARSLGVGAFG